MSKKLSTSKVVAMELKRNEIIEIDIDDLAVDICNIRGEK